MKTKNTEQNKLKFFSIYYGQKKVNTSNDIEDKQTAHNQSIGIKEIYLLLKPLSKISDEDAECVIKLVFAASINFNIEEFRKQIVLLILTNWNKSEVYDYLRSKGYALPYMGLSVEDLIEYGWIKLEEKK